MQRRTGHSLRTIGIGAAGVLALLVVLTLLVRGDPDEPREGEGVMFVAFSPQTVSGGRELALTVDSVDIWSEEHGWIALLNAPFDISLEDSIPTDDALFVARRVVDAGAYARVRVGISQATLIEASGEQTDLILPSSFFTLPAQSSVPDGGNGSVQLSFDPSRSLHEAEDGTPVLLPVLVLETRTGVRVDRPSDAHIAFTGGEVVAGQTYGAHLDGTMRANVIYRSQRGLMVEDGIVQERPPETTDSITPPAPEDDPGSALRFLPDPSATTTATATGAASSPDTLRTE